MVPARREDHEPALSLIDYFPHAQRPAGRKMVRGAAGKASTWCGTDQGLASLVFHFMHPHGSPMEDRDPVTRAGAGPRYG